MLMLCLLTEGEIGYIYFPQETLEGFPILTGSAKIVAMNLFVEPTVIWYDNDPLNFANCFRWFHSTALRSLPNNSFGVTFCLRVLYSLLRCLVEASCFY